MSLIYQPKGRAGEYAEWALNIYRGCGHGCTYCYAPNVLRMDRHAFYGEPVPRYAPDVFCAMLEKELSRGEVEQPSGLFDTTPPVTRGGATVAKQVLLCFTTDPYQPIDAELGLTRRVIEILHRYGMSVCVLTKGGTRALRDLDLFTPADAFATTLTACDDEERGAASTADRLYTLGVFHDAGIPTWVSCEPVIDPNMTLSLIRESAPWVDLYKVGMWNYDARAKGIDWLRFGEEAVTLLESLGKRYIIKADLLEQMRFAPQAGEKAGTK